MIIKSSIHSGDLFALDSMEGYVATGGMDNKVVIWNSLSATARTIIDMPKVKANTFISFVKFVKTNE